MKTLEEIEEDNYKFELIMMEDQKRKSLWIVDFFNRWSDTNIDDFKKIQDALSIEDFNILHCINIYYILREYEINLKEYETNCKRSSFEDIINYIKNKREEQKQYLGKNLNDESRYK